MPTPEEQAQLEALKTTWPKHWPPLEELLSGNPEIAVLVLAGRLYQLELDLMEVARVAAGAHPKAAKRIEEYFAERDRKLKDTVTA